MLFLLTPTILHRHLPSCTHTLPHFNTKALDDDTVSCNKFLWGLLIFFIFRRTVVIREGRRTKKLLVKASGLTAADVLMEADSEGVLCIHEGGKVSFVCNDVISVYI